MQVQAFFHIWCLKQKSKSASTKVYDVYDPNKRYQVALCQKGSGWWFQPIHTIQFSGQLFRLRSSSQAWCRITKPSEPEAETATRNLDHTLTRVSSGRTSHFHAERPLGTAIFPLGHCCLNGLQKAMGLLHLATHSYLYVICCIQKKRNKTSCNLHQPSSTQLPPCLSSTNLDVVQFRQAFLSETGLSQKVYDRKKPARTPEFKHESIPKSTNAPVPSPLVSMKIHKMTMTYIYIYIHLESDWTHAKNKIKKQTVSVTLRSQIFWTTDSNPGINSVSNPKEKHVFQGTFFKPPFSFAFHLFVGGLSHHFGGWNMWAKPPTLDCSIWHKFLVLTCNRDRMKKKESARNLFYLIYVQEFKPLIAALSTQMKLGVIRPGSALQRPHYDSDQTSPQLFNLHEWFSCVQEPPQESQVAKVAIFRPRPSNEDELKLMKHLGENHKAPKIGINVVNPIS